MLQLKRIKCCPIPYRLPSGSSANLTARRGSAELCGCLWLPSYFKHNVVIPNMVLPLKRKLYYIDRDVFWLILRIWLSSWHFFLTFWFFPRSLENLVGDPRRPKADDDPRQIFKRSRNKIQIGTQPSIRLNAQYSAKIKRLYTCDRDVYAKSQLWFTQYISETLAPWVSC